MPTATPTTNIIPFNIQTVLAGENTRMPPNIPMSINLLGVPSMNLIEQNDYQGVGNIYMPYLYAN